MRHSGTQRIRRFGATLGFAAIIAGIGAPSAFAQLGLPESNAPVTGTTNALAGTVQQTVDSAVAAVPVPAVSETVAPAVDTAKQTTDSTVASATKTTDEVAQTATQTVAPVVERVEQTVTPVVDDLVETAGSTVDRTRSAVESTAAPTRSPTTPTSTEPTPALTTAPTLAAASDKQHPSTAVESAFPLIAPTPLRSNAAPTSKDSTAPHARQPADVFPLPSAPAGDLGVIPNGAVPSPSSQLRSPFPGIPSGPLTVLFGASASAGGGALVALLAVLAASIFLAAPGLGRRLRPRLAPWPQPILHLSLERPG